MWRRPSPAVFKLVYVEQQKIGELIMKKQTELRAKAAEEAKKVYEEQMAKQA